jgi:hypothetical protein
MDQFLTFARPLGPLILEADQVLVGLVTVLALPDFLTIETVVGLATATASMATVLASRLAPMLAFVATVLASRLALVLGLVATVLALP